MSFETNKENLNKILQSSNQNQIDIEEKNKYEIFDKPESYKKMNRTINLIKHYNFPYDIVDKKYSADDTHPFDARVTVLSGKYKRTSVGGNDTMVIMVDLPNFPEWMIPFVKVVPKLYFDDAIYDQHLVTDEWGTYFSTLSYNTICSHYWRKVNNEWKLRIELFAGAYTYSPYAWVNSYLDVDLVFINELKWEEYNNNKE